MAEDYSVSPIGLTLLQRLTLHHHARAKHSSRGIHAFLCRQSKTGIAMTSLGQV
jgi:hypothetical protein